MIPIDLPPQLYLLARPAIIRSVSPEDVRLVQEARREHMRGMVPGFMPMFLPTGVAPVVPTTWNPSDKGAACTLSNANLTATSAASGYGFVRSIYSASSGKFYFEITIGSVSGGGIVGAAKATANINSYFGAAADDCGYYNPGGKYRSGSSTAYGASYTAGDVISILLDMDAGEISFWKNGVSQGVAFTGLSGAYFAAVSDLSNGAGCAYTANFGATAFTYTPPAGYRRGFGA